MIKAVIFDMDGVIIDSEPYHLESDKMLMKDYNKEISDDELYNYVGVSSLDMWTELRDKYKLTATIEELLEKLIHYKKCIFCNRKLEPIDGIIELLTDLKNRGISIGLASSSKTEFIEIILNNLDIKKYFQVVISGEDVLKGKPAPDIFLKAAELLKVESANCIVIEDSGHGVKAAKSAGMGCIGFINPNSGKQDLSMSDAIVYSINEIDFEKIVASHH